MKTEEDEAFDDVERKQGGGFLAKRAMAKTRIEEDDDIQVYKKPWVGLTDEEIQDAIIESNLIDDYPQKFVAVIESKLKEKNA